MKGQLLFRITANYCGVDMGNSGIRKEGVFLPEHAFDRLAIKYAVYNTCRSVKKYSVLLKNPERGLTDLLNTPSSEIIAGNISGVAFPGMQQLPCDGGAPFEPNV